MFDLWDFIKEHIILIIFVIILIIEIIEVHINKHNHIQNLEEKLNIYERSYEEFCLEDSIRQVE